MRCKPAHWDLILVHCKTIVKHKTLWIGVIKLSFEEKPLSFSMLVDKK